MLSICSCAFWPSICLLGRKVYLDLLSIFWLGYLIFLILSCMSCFYILEINPLSVTSFASIFSHSVNCLFILFVVSFAVQKLLSFIRSHLFIFVFIFITLGDGSKKILLQFMSKSVLHSLFYSILCNNLYGKRIWKRIDICIFITKSLCCTPEANTTF